MERRMETEQGVFGFALKVLSRIGIAALRGFNLGIPFQQSKPVFFIARAALNVVRSLRGGLFRVSAFRRHEELVSLLVCLFCFCGFS